MIKAQKQVGPFKRAGKWVKAHKKTIYLSAATLGALISAYQIWRLYKNKAVALRNKSELDALKKRLSKLHHTADDQIKHLQDPEFKEWLRNKHAVHIEKPKFQGVKDLDKLFGPRKLPPGVTYLTKEDLENM